MAEEKEFTFSLEEMLALAKNVSGWDRMRFSGPPITYMIRGMIENVEISMYDGENKFLFRCYVINPNKERGEERYERRYLKIIGDYKFNSPINPENNPLSGIQYEIKLLFDQVNFKLDKPENNQIRIKEEAENKRKEITEQAEIQAVKQKEQDFMQPIEDLKKKYTSFQLTTNESYGSSAIKSIEEALTQIHPERP